MGQQDFVQTWFVSVQWKMGPETAGLVSGNGPPGGEGLDTGSGVATAAKRKFSGMVLETKEEQSMNSRDKILQSVRKNLPQGEDLPLPRTKPPEKLDLPDRFAFHMEAIGGIARFFPSRESALKELEELDKDIYLRDLIRGIESNPQGKEEPEVTIVDALIAVAENAAVYITDREVDERSTLFLGHKLIALVPQNNLIEDMHEAYKRVDLTAVGFGIFIAGPSATADIAQILVRGAHGPAQMEVWLYE